MAAIVGGLGLIRKAQPKDADAIWDFLNPRRATSMFLSGNLKDHGINTHGCTKANTVWLGMDKDRIAAVFGLTESGYLVFEAPSFRTEWARQLCAQMSDRTIRGINGVWDQFVKVREALGLTQATGAFDVRQPHYNLHLRALIVPAGDGELRVTQSRDLSFLREWRFAANVEVMSVPDTDVSRTLASGYAEELVQNGRGRVLLLENVPVSMTAFNAVSGSCVQVGSVFTPHELRGKGFARRAVALHLEEARQDGINEAILFAANDTAARAYEAIGFSKIGEYGMVDFLNPQVILDIKR